MQQDHDGFFLAEDGDRHTYGTILHNAQLTARRGDRAFGDGPAECIVYIFKGRWHYTTTEYMDIMLAQERIGMDIVLAQEQSGIERWVRVEALTGTVYGC
jgi:hypothetical protein